MSDYLLDGVLESLHIGIRVASTRDLVNQAVLAHDCDPYAAHILGRSLTAALLAGPKTEGQRLSIRWGYEGAVKTLMVEVAADGATRGMIRPSQLAAYGDTEDDFYGEKGVLQVITFRDADILNSGATAARLLDPVRDLGFHLSTSDQVETGISVMIGFDPDPKKPVRLCQGIMVQAQPGCDLLLFDDLRLRLEQNEEMRDVLQQPMPDPKPVLDLLWQDLPEPPKIRLKPLPQPHWSCRCSQEKILSVITALPQEDRDELTEIGDPVTIRCDFCNRAFTWSIEECVAVWES